MSNIILDTKNVGKIKGLFYLPDYQRGYRWTSEEIKLLLDDIYESAGKPYCLQPIVVKKSNERFELIDGQQRLTTIYLICKYMEAKLGDLYEPSFKLEYETRKESANFLGNIDLSLRELNIDYYFIASAYEYIEQYFTEKTQGERREMAAYLTKLNEYFISSVNVIWYEVDSAENGIELFERLNIGKIPLTSSELVKALFLKDSVRDKMSGRQEEVSLQWDMIEQELQNPSFWGFLSNIDGDQMPTRIDLILDLMVDKSGNDREKYRTFFYFDRQIKSLSETTTENPLLEIWSRIYHVFLTLREWYTNHDFYHKIGYLITIGVPLRKIYTVWQNDGNTPLDEFAHFNDDVLFGENWNNNDIDVKTRSIITVVALMAQGITDSSLKFHLQNAKDHGVSQKEIAAVITHVGFYAGWPKAWAVFNLAKEVWEVNEGDLPYEDEAMRAHAKSMVFSIGQPNDAFAQYFIGHSYLFPVSTSQVGVFNVTFEPGCRNNWHIHHAKSGGGQILVCVGGRGYYQEEGKPAVEMKTGDCINIPAEVKHWHGAAPDSWFSHLAIEVPGEETSNEWCEPVTDEEYGKLR